MEQRKALVLKTKALKQCSDETQAIEHRGELIKAYQITIDDLVKTVRQLSTDLRESVEPIMALRGMSGASDAQQPASDLFNRLADENARLKNQLELLQGQLRERDNMQRKGEAALRTTEDQLTGMRDRLCEAEDALRGKTMAIDELRVAMAEEEKRFPFERP